MKRLILLILALGALGLSQAFAIPKVTMQPFIAGANGNYSAQPNAEFAYVLDNYVLGKSKTNEGWFGTFCLEKNEFFSPGQTYNVALNDGSVMGGKGGNIVGGKDIISKGTAHLYQLFAMGTLAELTYGASSSAKELQDMFWYLEGEIGSIAATNPFIAPLTTKYTTLDNAKANYTGTAVGVMNLTGIRQDGSVTKNQDQLVFLGVPDGGMTLSLLGLSLVGMAAFRRRFNR